LKNFLFIALVSVFFVSCGKIDLYEKQAQIPAQQWFYNYVPEFTFHIDDTSSLYNVYIVLRHTDLYNYNNIWLNIGSKTPGDSMHFQKVNLTLASDAKGWEGRGTGDIFEVRKNISPGPVSFKRSGDYTFSIAQIMRENPLRYILNVGIRLEKVEM
jgi:gliding motility-associated lipoprotein GldH